MEKSTKIILLAAVAALAALALLWLARSWFSGCGDVDADLVFVSQSDTPVGSVSLDRLDSTEVGQHADSSPLKRGESFGFGVESYPVTVTVYQQVGGKGRLASCVIEEGPAKGERWYVVARDGEEGMELEVSSQWPAEDAKTLGAERSRPKTEQLIWDEGSRSMENWEIWGIALTWTVLLALPLLIFVLLFGGM